MAATATATRQSFSQLSLRKRRRESSEHHRNGWTAASRCAVCGGGLGCVGGGSPAFEGRNPHEKGSAPRGLRRWGRLGRYNTQDPIRELGRGHAVAKRSLSWDSDLYAKLVLCMVCCGVSGVCRSLKVRAHSVYK